MPGRQLRVALLGGVPAILGGGGVEVQIARTAAALQALGHDARPIHEFGSQDELDVVHAFNHGGDIVQFVDHWRRTPAAFVFSPVLVVAPSHEWRTRVGRHLPIPAFPARAIRDLVRKADVTIGLTAWEARFMAQLAGVDASRCIVVGNGVDPVAGAPASDIPELPEAFVVSVGSVSARKRQAELAGVLAGGDLPYVVIGGLDGDTQASALEQATTATGGRWLGEIRDAALVRAIVARARALVLLSEREGQSLAVLEALSVGTPVIVSDLPSHRELAAAHPGWVTIVSGPADVAAAAEQAARRTAGQPTPAIATWEQVATQLVAAYSQAMTAPPRTGQQRP